MNARVLIVVNSVYQLLTALHLRRTLLSEAGADLLLTDVLPDRDRYAGRTEKAGLFGRVLRADCAAFNREFAGKKDSQLDPAFRDIPRKLGWMVDGALDAYDEIYFSNFDPFTRLLACCYYAPQCAFICYEDGFSTYVIDYLRADRAPINRHPEGRKLADKVQAVMLYEPRLAMRGDVLENRPIPRIAPEDRAFRDLLNGIFGYHAPESNADFIFLEQSFRAENIRTNDIELMQLCRDAVGPERFIVKAHPRNTDNLPALLGLTRRYLAGVPWELFLLNEDPSRYTVITVCSNAALTPRIVFGMDINTVMLYPLFEGRVLWKEDEVLRRYLRTFQLQFAGQNYYVPRTVYELRETLRFLGGNA